MPRGRIVTAAFVAVAAGIVLVELQPLLAAARLIECLVVLMLLAILAWATRGRLRDTLLVVCSLLAGLSVLEGVSLAMVMSAGERGGSVADDSGLAKGRPIIGWGPTRPGRFHSIKSAADGHPIFDTYVTIDDTLNRKTVPSGGLRPIVFFGDSWIYGDGVDDAGTLPQAFADLNGGRVPVLNLAFAGWSPAQNLAALQQGLYTPLLKSPRHFILFTATFHLERTACKAAYAISRAPRYVLEGDGVRTTGTCADASFAVMAPIMRIARRFTLYERIAPYFAMPSRRDVETYIKIVETFVATAKRDYGVQTTVLFAPFDQNFVKGSGYSEAEILAAWQKAGLDVLVDKLPKIADEALYSIADDGHPTALANKARAEEVEAHLRKVDPEALEASAER